MKVINKGSNIKILWMVFRGENKVSEDFANTNLKVFLVGAENVYAKEPVINTSVEPGYQLIEIDIAANSIREGAYDLKAIWQKNNGRDIISTRRCGIFGITDSKEEAGVVALETIRIASYVESYGRDGMSAYETAVMYGLNEGILTEREWVENTISKVDIVQTPGYDETKVMSQKAVTEAILNHTGGGGNSGPAVIPQGSITTEMLGNKIVTKDKLGDGAVSESKIEDNSVSHRKLSMAMQMTIDSLQEDYTKTDNENGNLRFYSKYALQGDPWELPDNLVIEPIDDYKVIFATDLKKFVYAGPLNDATGIVRKAYINFNIKSLGISTQGYAYNPNIEKTFTAPNGKHYQWDSIGSDIVEVLGISEVNNKAEYAVASAQSASVAAGNAIAYAQSLTERLGQAEQTANNASATATSANNVAVAASAEVANLRTQLNGKVGSTTITAIESITQSAYDTKKALGELSDTTAYLITE